MHFPSTYLNYSFLHLEKMHPSLEVFKEIQRGCWDDARNAANRKHKYCPLQARKSHPPCDACPCLQKAQPSRAPQRPLGRISPDLITALSVNTHLFIHSLNSFVLVFLFVFCTPPCLALGITSWIGHSAHLQGDCLGGRQPCQKA